MTSRLLYLFTRTPLHVGAGSSVGAIDQPIVRERHTGFPIIPASSLKGSFADQWPTTLRDEKDQQVRVTAKKVDGKIVADEVSEAAWLFGSDDAKEGLAAAGALLFGEARLLAFPIRSAKGSYAWITSPLILRRAARDGVIDEKDIPDFPADKDADGKALFAKSGPLTLPGGQLVLEEYTFTFSGGDEVKLNNLGKALKDLLPKDPVWKDIAARLVILSDGQLSFFATTACEVAQHVRISDETGTADPGGLFNQENVPSETLFYAVLHATDSRLKGKAYQGQAHSEKTADEAIKTFTDKVNKEGVFQFGGDASTGLGYCTVRIDKPAKSDEPATKTAA